jgi:hypothetical protein
MTPKRKPVRRGKAAPLATRGTRPRKRSPVVDPPLRQGLLELATLGAQSFVWIVLAAATVVAVAGSAYAVWSLRPVPAYTSDGVQTGSPFDVTFRIENASPWFPLAHLSIDCVLMHAEAPNLPPIAASDVAMPAGDAAQLGPGESATFKCPFRAALRGTTDDELGIALRSEIYFRSTYDLPLVGSLRLTDHRGPFVLNTRLLPPRWSGKP